ncbi:hypothetical protein CsSME_00046144 [Camellia sinensis var. sinensis]
MMKLLKWQEGWHWRKVYWQFTVKCFAEKLIHLIAEKNEWHAHHRKMKKKKKKKEQLSCSGVFFPQGIIISGPPVCLGARDEGKEKGLEKGGTCPFPPRPTRFHLLKTGRGDEGKGLPPSF